jgi:mannose-6-phosphate isomerase-like protein (cupin superfamily)
MPEGVEVYRWTEQGYRPLVFSDGWMVALLNWEPIMDLEKATEIERHKETDEVFILLKGHAALYVTTAEGMRVVEMQPGLIYNVRKNTWHNLLASHDVALLIVENRDTHLHDTETRNLSPSEMDTLKKNLALHIFGISSPRAKE